MRGSLEIPFPVFAVGFNGAYSRRYSPCVEGFPNGNLGTRANQVYSRCQFSFAVGTSLFPEPPAVYSLGKAGGGGASERLREHHGAMMRFFLVD